MHGAAAKVSKMKQGKAGRDMDHTQLRCWAQIDLDALAANYAVIRQHTEGAAIMAVV